MDIKTLIGYALTISMVMAGAGVGLTILPLRRQKAVSIMPIVLAATTFTISSYLLLTKGLPVYILLTGNFGASWINLCTSLVIGVPLTLLAFILEATGTRLWYQKNISHDVSFVYIPVAGRSETMNTVAEIAQRKTVFAFLSAFSACGEELFYRGVFLLGGLTLTHEGILTLLFIQAILYGINHVAFGVPAIIGKSAFGFILGIVALFGGILTSILMHLLYQTLVARQFQKGRGDHS